VAIHRQFESQGSVAGNINMIAGFPQTLRDVFGHGGVVFNAKDAAHGCDFMPLITKNSSTSTAKSVFFFPVYHKRCYAIG
jgi:hypothetical protein